MRTLTQGITDLLEKLDIADADHRASSILSEMVGALALSRMHSDAAEAEALLDHSRRSILQSLKLG
ncbi:hypothetical protein [Sphingomonas sp. UYP23]